MDAIIALAISAVGFYCCKIDFCTLFTFVSVSMSLHKSWTDYTNDKTSRR